MSIIRNVNQNVKEWIKNESIDYDNPMCLRVALAVALAKPEIKNILKSKRFEHYTKRLIEYDF